MTIVIAGGTKGIGLELARGFSEVKGRRSPPHIILGYANDRIAAQAAQAELQQKGCFVTIVPADLSHISGAQTLINATQDNQPIDCLIHSAVQFDKGLLSKHDSELSTHAWQEALTINAASLLFLVRAARPKLKHGSTILYLTSTGARRVVPGYGSIGPAKALGEALVKYLAVELAQDGIRINALAPGQQHTTTLRKIIGDDRIDSVLERARKLNPSGRLIEPTDYVEVAKFLASDSASMVNGQVHYVHGAADLL